MKNYYEVIVGNVGCVHFGHNYKHAMIEYKDWIKLSRATQGRASGEPVSLLMNSHIVCEVDGSNAEIGRVAR